MSNLATNVCSACNDCDSQTQGGAQHWVPTFPDSRTCQALRHTATVATISFGSSLCKCHSSGLLACAVARQGLIHSFRRGLCIRLCDTCSAATHRVSAGPAQLYASTSRKQAASSICAGTQGPGPGKEASQQVQHTCRTTGNSELHGAWGHPYNSVSSSRCLITATAQSCR
jgi:hypothetical protein